MTDKIQAKVEQDKYGASLSTTQNGWQWLSQNINPELAQKIVMALSDYLLGVTFVCGMCGNIYIRKEEELKERSGDVDPAVFTVGEEYETVCDNCMQNLLREGLLP